MKDHLNYVNQQCGKIVSSIEKTEENLKTGEKTMFDASNQWGN